MVLDLLSVVPLFLLYGVCCGNHVEVQKHNRRFGFRLPGSGTLSSRTYMFYLGAEGGPRAG